MNILFRNLKYILFTSALAGSAFANDFNKATRIRDLTDRTQLEVSYSLEMDSFSDEHNNDVYFVNFDNKTPKHYDLPAMDSHVKLQTNTRYARVGYMLKKGIYCLDREKSTFGSHGIKFQIDLYDHLFFRTCENGEPAFVLYLNAGYTLRFSEGFNGFTIRDFEDQVGNAMQFVR
jgi:hypothetical protein